MFTAAGAAGNLMAKNLCWHEHSFQNVFTKIDSKPVNVFTENV